MGGAARAGPGGAATLQGLRAATNYSVWVRARTDAGAGPPAAPVYCATRDDGQSLFFILHHIMRIYNIEFQVT